MAIDDDNGNASSTYQLFPCQIKSVSSAATNACTILNGMVKSGFLNYIVYILKQGQLKIRLHSWPYFFCVKLVH